MILSARTSISIKAAEASSRRSNEFAGADAYSPVLPRHSIEYHIEKHFDIYQRGWMTRQIRNVFKAP